MLKITITIKVSWWKNIMSNCDVEKSKFSVPVKKSRGADKMGLEFLNIDVMFFN